MDEWTGTLTLTEASSNELMRVLEEQDTAFMNDLFDGRRGVTLRCADGRSVKLIPSAEITADDVVNYCRPRLLTVVAKEALPFADRPQGEWIDAEIPLESGGAMPIQVCSLCKTFYPLAYTGGGHRFCPNCGAKMKGENE